MDQETDEKPAPFQMEDLVKCAAILKSLAEESGPLSLLTDGQRIALLSAAGKLSRPDRREINKRRKEKNRELRQAIIEKEKAHRAGTGIRLARTAAVFEAPSQIAAPETNGNAPSPELHSPRNCYVCKKEYTELHFFYDAMCRSCGDFNYRKRFQSAPLHGKTALITGSRVKIGFQAALKMLRAGARVIATTRFPVDAAIRFSSEADFDTFKDRLDIYGLDLRHTPSVELFTAFITSHYDRLDILINNAAQTVRRPPGFYAHLMEKEELPFEAHPDAIQGILKQRERLKNRLSSQGEAAPITEQRPALPISWNGSGPGIGLRESPRLSLIPYHFEDEADREALFPKGALDQDLQQVDLRKTNSWRLRLGEVNTAEMFETHLINAVAPFVLCNNLLPLMRRDQSFGKHIVNVTAMEGKFFRFKQSSRHPHTNMAKAALNMLTHTAAADLLKEGVFINAVDTGWVTDEDPAELAKRKEELHDFQPPLDIVDGAARICDPFFDGLLTGNHWSGKFLKDYFPIDW
jgi:NAD(P)-dependent dehydrogenase (short-subunit alcohol dehydrogenase family)